MSRALRVTTSTCTTLRWLVRPAIGAPRPLSNPVHLGVTIQAPKLDITTVAAGGGSRLFFRSGLFVVGPESSGAEPGPVCYRKGGHLSVTDANLFLGRIVPEHFPKIFGPNRDEPLDAQATRAAFVALTKEVNAYYAVRVHCCCIQAAERGS